LIDSSSISHPPFKVSKKASAGKRQMSNKLPINLKINGVASPCSSTPHTQYIVMRQKKKNRNHKTKILASDIFRKAIISF
jgi:hypothetical protein